MSIKRRVLIGSLLAAPAVIRAARAASPVLPDYVSPPMGPGPIQPGVLPRWQQFAVPRPRGDMRPALTIVIDDLGVMHAATERAVALPGPLTLSWFPFARDLPVQVAAAAARGHESTLHMPMQATGNTTNWTGPDPLRIDLPPAENLRRLKTALDAVPQTVGLNNHMGSVATRDVALMDMVAAEVHARGMLLLDSVTIPHSVAYRQAMMANVPAAYRDVFLDDKSDKAAILTQLEDAVRIAKRWGNVIAIGHPRRHTLDVLEAWLPTVASRGLALVPLSATVAYRNEIAMPAQAIA